jgi:hypothetical protein
VNEVNVHRIHGSPEQWLREFIETTLAAYPGRVYGACVHLEIQDEADPESSFTSVYFNWPSSAQMMGRLFTTATQLALRHCGLPERGEP